MPQRDPERNAVASAQRHALELLPLSRRFNVGPALDEELPPLIRLAEAHLPRLKASEPAIWRVHRRCQSILAVRAQSGLAGVFALLFLSVEGLRRLAEGTLNVGAPEDVALAPVGQRPAALYVWAICMPGSAVGALGNVMNWLRRPQYVGCDMFARPDTSAGRRIIVKTGFERVNRSSENTELWVYRRSNAMNFLVAE